MNFKAGPHVAWRRVGEEVVLLDLRKRVYFSLNATGAEVWELLGRGLSEERIAAELSELHGVAARTVRRDVDALIDRLQKAGLVVFR